jgi:DNA-directed RNA polymerase subunit beta
MNIGQVLEIHLSLAAKVLGFNVATPIFDGANENDIMDTLDMANAYANHPFDDEELAREKADAEANGEEYPRLSLSNPPCSNLIKCLCYIYLSCISLTL